MAPELLKTIDASAQEPSSGGYDEACDMWSIGVLLYTMLCGYPPFHTYPGQPLTEVRKAIANASIEFPITEWCEISAAARELVKSLLVVDARVRLSSDAAMNHAWVVGYGPLQQSLDDSFTPTVPTGAMLQRRGSDLLSPRVLGRPEAFKRTRSNLGDVLESVQTSAVKMHLGSVTESKLHKRFFFSDARHTLFSPPIFRLLATFDERGLTYMFGLKAEIEV